jgi:hypothetical protein
MALGEADAKALFDSSAVILYFNDALPHESIALMQQAIVAGTGAISVITRAEVLAWPSHTPTSIEAAMQSETTRCTDCCDCQTAKNSCDYSQRT